MLDGLLGCTVGSGLFKEGFDLGNLCRIVLQMLAKQLQQFTAILRRGSFERLDIQVGFFIFDDVSAHLLSKSFGVSKSI